MQLQVFKIIVIMQMLNLNSESLYLSKFVTPVLNAIIFYSNVKVTEFWEIQIYVNTYLLYITMCS